MTGPRTTLIPLGQFLTAVGTVVGVVGGLWIKNKRDDNSMQKYVMRVMQQQNRETNADIKQAKHDYQELRQLTRPLCEDLMNRLG
ncbi:hypothetical protein [Lactiplantibacillus plantarum]|uniref:hypothetical protein n=1 Tax=Lactiplantibacillus plantarum TaxID=1590 RepID=UPI003C23591E